jgi:hypothetical protein
MTWLSGTIQVAQGWLGAECSLGLEQTCISSSKVGEWRAFSAASRAAHSGNILAVTPYISMLMSMFLSTILPKLSQ